MRLVSILRSRDVTSRSYLLAAGSKLMLELNAARSSLLDEERLLSLQQCVRASA